MSGPSLFSLTSYNSGGSIDVRGSIREVAHGNITKRGYNAYEAWMYATCGYIPNDLHEMVGLTAEAYTRWCEKGQVVLPPENTLQFCLKMQIHPAHLVPGFFEKEKSYPEAIVNLMTNLLKEKPKRQIADILGHQEITLSDKGICIAAFASELERYRVLSEKHKNFKAYTTVSMQNIAGKAQDEFKVPGLERIFNYAIGFHASDIDEALDFHGAYLMDLDRDTNARKTDQSYLLSKSLSNLEFMGNILYGERRARQAIDDIVKVLDRIKPEDRIEFWIKGEEDIVDSYNRGDNWDTIFNFPVLSADLELEAANEHCDIDHLKDKFLSELRNYHEYLIEFRKITDAAKVHSNGLKRFQNWKDDVMTQEELIPAFRNYVMIKPYLEEAAERAKQRRLPDYSSKPSINPV